MSKPPNVVVVDIAKGGTTIFQFEQIELAVRIFEGAFGVSRLPGAARATLDAMAPDTRASVLRAATNAWGYFQEGMQNGMRPS